jgi:hypothetical protein
MEDASMSELTEKLTALGQKHKGSELGKLLQWAALHIQSQDEALTEARKDLAEEEAERLRLERALHTGSLAITTVLDCLKAAQPVNIKLSRDHAPHINVMAHHGVTPYARKPRKPKESA